MIAWKQISFKQSSTIKKIELSHSPFSLSQTYKYYWETCNAFLIMIFGKEVYLNAIRINFYVLGKRTQIRNQTGNK
jgi:hypothetical protein